MSCVFLVFPMSLASRNLFLKFVMTGRLENPRETIIGRDKCWADCDSRVTNYFGSLEIFRKAQNRFAVSNFFALFRYEDIFGYQRREDQTMSRPIPFCDLIGCVTLGSGCLPLFRITKCQDITSSCCCQREVEFFAKKDLIAP